MAQQARILNDRYQVEDHLGSGGMAQVFRGTDTVLGRPVAIKLLDRRYRDDAKFVARFRREAQSAAGINHPNVVSIYDTGSEDGTHYIVMEYVDGETLGDLLAREKRLPPSRAVAIAEPVAQALEAAHAKGMVHRDVKPGNIMIDRHDTVKVVDFGIARAAADDTLTQTGIVLGTAAYLSPEQAQGLPVDPRSDVYSLGCVLYESLTGRKPFQGESPLAIAYKHVREDPVPPSEVQPDIPPEIEAVVVRAMAKDPDQRFASGGAMREALSAAATGEMPVMAGAATEPLARGGDTAVMTSPEEAPPAEHVPPERPQRWWLPWAVIVAILVALIALGFLAFGGQEEAGRTGGGPAAEDPPQEEAPADPVADAYQNLVAALHEGVAAGEVSESTAAEIAASAQEAVTAYGAGDGDTAAQWLGQAYARILEAAETGEITSPERIEGALLELASAMDITLPLPEAPAEEDDGDDEGEGEGNGDEGRGNGGPPPHAENEKGKGKEKDKD